MAGSRKGECWCAGGLSFPGRSARNAYQRSADRSDEADCVSSTRRSACSLAGLDSCSADKGIELHCHEDLHQCHSLTNTAISNVLCLVRDDGSQVEIPGCRRGPFGQQLVQCFHPLLTSDQCICLVYDSSLDCTCCSLSHYLHIPNTSPFPAWWAARQRRIIPMLADPAGWILIHHGRKVI